MEQLRKVRMSPYIESIGRTFILETWDTYRTDRMGKTCIAYRLSYEQEDVTIFEEEDFHCSPVIAIDSDECLQTLLGFLTLREGDVEEDYFEDYNDVQKDFRDEDAETLSLYTLDEDAEEFEDID